MTKDRGPMSGFRDFLPDSSMQRSAIIQQLAMTYRLHGYSPLETPAVERLSTLTGKYGDEGEKLIYHVSNSRGVEGKAALRYDLTVPLARVISMYDHQLPRPFKRYQIAPVWRGDRPQAGRYREFTQADVDTVGSSSSLTDAETVHVMGAALDQLGIKSTIHVSNRRLLDALGANCGVQSEAEYRELIGILDKADKKGDSWVTDAVKRRFGVSAGQIVSDYLSLATGNARKIKKVSRVLNETGDGDVEAGVSNLQEVFRTLRGNMPRSQRVVFDPSIARGLDYYTGMIMEARLQRAPDFGSISGGGRYDNLIALMSDGKIDRPAVGFSIGVDRLIAGMDHIGAGEVRKTPTDVLITNFDNRNSGMYLQLANKLRTLGVACDVFHDGAVRLGKQMKQANKHGIPYVIFMGEEEIDTNTIKIRNMSTGQEDTIGVDKIAEFFSPEELG